MADPKQQYKECISKPVCGQGEQLNHLLICVATPKCIKGFIAERGTCAVLLKQNNCEDDEYLETEKNKCLKKKECAKGKYFNTIKKECYKAKTCEGAQTLNGKGVCVCKDDEYFNVDQKKCLDKPTCGKGTTLDSNGKCSKPCEAG